MSIKKIISYILCNKGIRVNLYKLPFPFSHFSLQPNKRVFHLSTFSPPNLLTFLSSLHFLSSHFSILPTKGSLGALVHQTLF